MNKKLTIFIIYFISFCIKIVPCCIVLGLDLIEDSKDLFLLCSLLFCSLFDIIRFLTILFYYEDTQEQKKFIVIILWVYRTIILIVNILLFIFLIYICIASYFEKNISYIVILLYVSYYSSLFFIVMTKTYIT